MKASKYFTPGKNDIGYVSELFTELFGDMEIGKSKFLLESKILGRSMNDKEILSAFKPDPVSLGDLAHALKSLDKNGWYIIYVKDSKDTLRAVFVGWNYCGWDVSAFSVEDPSGWGADYRVLSRRFSDSKTLDPSTLRSLDSLPDTLTINGVKYVKEN